MHADKRQKAKPRPRESPMPLGASSRNLVLDSVFYLMVVKIDCKLTKLIHLLSLSLSLSVPFLTLARSLSAMPPRGAVLPARHVRLPA